MPWNNQAIALIVLEEEVVGFSGLFGYSPAGGPGNLTFSIAAADGTDPFDNAYLADNVTYGLGGLGFVALQNTGAALEWWTAASEAGPWTQPAANFPSIHLFLASVAGGGDVWLTAVESGFALGEGAEIWLLPTGDQSGAGDYAIISAALSVADVVHLVPGKWYLNATVTGHEGQYVRGAGKQATFVNIVGTGLAAFQWTPENPGVYSVYGKGGVTGITIVGPSGNPNPSDGSIGVQMADIVQLESDCEYVDLEYGLLQSNQYWFSEQGHHRVVSQSCTNPVVLECAATGGSNRTGSFDRSCYTVYHNDYLNGSFGGAGVAVRNGAQLEGGSIRQYGNFNTPTGGVGQTGCYALQVFGAAPAGPTGYASIIGCELVHAVESSAATDLPGTIYVATDSYIESCFGVLHYGDGFGPATISGAFTQFSGPISSDSTAQTALQAAQWSRIAGAGSLPSGWTGQVYYRLAAEGDRVYVEVELEIAAGTAITQLETLFTLPAGFHYSSNKELLGNYLGFGSNPATAYLTVTGGGAVQWTGAGVTTPSGGSSFLTASGSYSVVV